MNKRKIYTAYFQLTVNPASNASEVLQLFNQKRDMKILSIKFDCFMYALHAAAFVYYADESIRPTDQRCNFTIGNSTATGQMIGGALNRISGPALTNAGDYFCITKNAEYHFDSFFLSERLDMNFYAENANVADTYFYVVSILIEVEELENFR